MSDLDSEESDITRFASEADKIGLTEDARTKYILGRVERQQRAQDRELRKQEEERALELRKQEDDRALELRKQEDDRALELRKREDDRALEFKKEESRIRSEEADRLHAQGLEIAQLTDGRSKTSTGSESKTNRPRNYPKLPMFKESEDSIDSFLCRFETHAEAMHWPKVDYVAILSSLLSGQALEVYATLSQAGTVSYDEFKECLLTKFQLDADGFRHKFRSVRPEKSETCMSFSIRMSHFFGRWLEMSKVTNREELEDLVLREQFLASVSKDLAVFIRERAHTSLNEMVESADNYRKAHPEKLIARKDDKAGMSQNVDTPAAMASFDNQRSRGGQRRYNQRGLHSRGGTGRGHYNPQNPYSDQASTNDRGPRTTDNATSGNYTYRGRYTRRPQNHRGTNNDTANYKCRQCLEWGHIARDCTGPPKKPQMFCGPTPTAAATKNIPRVENRRVDYIDGDIEITKGKVNNIDVSVVHDSGAVTVGVRRTLIRPDQIVPGQKQTTSFGGNIECYDLAVVPIETEQYSGKVCACLIDDPVCDLLVGRLKRVTPEPKTGLFVGDVHDYAQPPAAAATTRAQAKKDGAKTKPLAKQKLSDQELNVDSKRLRELQQADPNLTDLLSKVESGNYKKNKKDDATFNFRDGVLYRYKPTARDGIQSQIVVPASLVPRVLFTAHDTLLAGHCGVNRTTTRVNNRFFWPGMTKDIMRYCQSCDICQKTADQSRTKPIPLDFMPRIDQPFKRVAIDLVGPLNPSSDEKHTHLLTIIDVATRYPEAIPLKKIDSATVAEALFAVFARMGFPEEIQSDNGSQFTSEMFKEYLQLLGINHVRSSAYHAQSNGVVERFHGTIKPMIRKVIEKQPKQWHRYLPALLFAVRELPNASTTFSPFELMFGRSPRGPIDLLANTWMGGKDAEEAKTVYQYVTDLKNHIYDACQTAHDEVDEARKTQKFYHDKKALGRKFKVGDQVLLLLATTANKLTMQLKGPYEIVEVCKNDYKIDIQGSVRLYHANMLKKYYQRPVNRTLTALAQEPKQQAKKREQNRTKQKLERSDGDTSTD